VLVSSTEHNIPNEIKGRRPKKFILAASDESLPNLESQGRSFININHQLHFDDDSLENGSPSSNQYFGRKGRILIFAYREKSQNTIKQGFTKSTTRQRRVAKMPQHTQGDTLEQDNTSWENSASENEEYSDEGPCSSSEEDNSAEETCSEGSTEPDSDGQSTAEDDFDVETEFGGDSSDEDEMATYLRHDFILTPQQFVEPVEPHLNDSSSEIGDEDGDLNSILEHEGITEASTDWNDTRKAVISLYDASPEKLERIFYYQQKMPVMLYHSPPVFHRSKSLVVWPLGAGDILFIDYISKSFFKRQLMPSNCYCKFQQLPSDDLYLFLINMHSSPSLYQNSILSVRTVSTYCHSGGAGC
jgi:hypothetical protein